VGAGARLDGAFAHGLAGGEQLASGALGERLGAHRGEHLVGGVQVGSCIDAAAHAPQPFAVEQVAAGELHPHTCPAEALDGVAVEPIGRLVVADHRTAARLQAQAPVATCAPSSSRSSAAAAPSVSPQRTAASTSSGSASVANPSSVGCEAASSAASNASR
jgi:hypothetical protein